MKELDVFRKHATIILDAAEKHDDELCLLQDRTEYFTAMREEIEEIQRFKVFTKTELIRLGTFRKQAKKKLLVVQGHGKT